jgi:hypothetical protein
VPADADALAFLPRRNALAHFVHNAGDFVAGDTGILNAGPQALFREYVTVANSTSLHLDPNVSGFWRRNIALDDFEISSRLGDLRHLHLRHLHWYYFAGRHKSSYKSYVVERFLPGVPNLRPVPWEIRGF